MLARACGLRTRGRWPKLAPPRTWTFFDVDPAAAQAAVAGQFSVGHAAADPAQHRGLRRLAAPGRDAVAAGAALLHGLRTRRAGSAGLRAPSGTQRSARGVGATAAGTGSGADGLRRRRHCARRELRAGHARRQRLRGCRCTAGVDAAARALRCVAAARVHLAPCAAQFGMGTGAHAQCCVPACRRHAPARQHAVPAGAGHLAGGRDRRLAVPGGVPARCVRFQRGQPVLAMGRGRGRPWRVRCHRRADGCVLRGVGTASGALLLLGGGAVRLRARAGHRAVAAVAGLGAVQPAVQRRCRHRLRRACRRADGRRAARCRAGGNRADARGLPARR
ncbi:hypothetical protein NB713_003397 [Xanthomonas sacchari]|nr:hypothetical protein [Xanthomonas sacchari]